jgi:ribulose kinase
MLLQLITNLLSFPSKTLTGEVKKIHVKEIKTWNPLPNHYEQSTDNIWRAVCECVKVI